MALRLPFFLCLVIVAFAAADLHRNWQVVFGDGLSYLETGEQILAGHRSLSYGLWGPLYSVLVAFAVQWVRPWGGDEIVAMRAVSIAMFILFLPALVFFMSEVRNLARKRGVAPGSPAESALLILGYLTTGYTSIHWIGLGTTTPDLGVAAATLCAAGLALRLLTRPGEKWVLPALGLVLGFGAWWKEPMFATGCAWLVTVGLGAAWKRRAWGQWLLAVILFAGMTVPLTSTLRSGGLTSASLNYMWHVNGIPNRFYVGGAPNGAPLHPPRQIHSAPAVFEFSTPFDVTYPVWYHPVYFYEGTRPVFDASRQLRVAAQNLRGYFEVLRSRWLALSTIGILAFLLLLRANPFRLAWPVTIPVLIPVGAVALVHWEPRYIAAFFSVLVTGCALAIASKVPAGRWGRAFLAMAVVSVLPMFADLVLRSRQPILPCAFCTTAAELQQLGVKPGDKIAFLGGHSFHTWIARKTKTRIVAQMPLQEWPNWRNAGPQARVRIYDELRNIGVSAIVAVDASPTDLGREIDWKQPSGTGLYVATLRKIH
ncbi:MAG: hypothetical protein IT168_33110 [Bryobacterales bacterium]|nr:hypothetical protein [Bryobacterales bacterium]